MGGPGKLVSVDRSTAVGVGSWLGGVSIRCPVVEFGWDNCRRIPVLLSGGEAPFRSSEAVAKE